MEQESSVPATLPALLDRAVRLYGEAPAVATSRGTLTYRDLQTTSARLARGLLAQGVGKGARVGLLAGNSAFWIQSFFACAQVGALLAPISTLAAPTELAHVLRHSDTQVLLATRHFMGRDYSDKIAQALPSLASAPNRRALRIPEAPFLRTVWLDDAGGVDWAGEIETLLSAGDTDPGLNDAFLEQVKSEITPSDDAVIIYTSGSTALPKAVVHSQGPMARHADVLARHHFAQPGERMLCVLPMFWVGGLSIMLETLTNGGCVVLPDGVSPRSVTDALRELRADVVWGWPAQRRPIRELAEAEGLDFSGVRGLRDERLPDGSLRRPDQAPNSLGMTESFGPHCAPPLGAILPDHRRGAFAPVIGGYERRVVDRATGAVLPPGRSGELQLRGGALMKGYYKRENSEVFTPDGFYPTHDLVRIEADGYMYFEGRTDDMLKTKGANVSRLEVEAALRGLAGVGEVVVCGLPDSQLGQRIVAAVVPATGKSPTEAELKAGLSDRLAAYKVPTNILIIDRDDLIWTASGKIRAPEVGKLVAERLGLSA